MVEYLQPPGGGGEVRLVPYDDAWPVRYTECEQRIRAALRPLAIEVHHAGSTSIPGMTAKPVVDVLLVVPDSTDEVAYVQPLEGAGFGFTLREPEWHEHRLFREEQPRVNLHVFGAGCPEVARMLAFRDHLLTDDADRELYLGTKLRLAARAWERVQDYADAKSDVVADIMTRALPD